MFLYAEIIPLLTPILAQQLGDSVNEHRASRNERMRNKEKIASRGTGGVSSKRRILASVKLLGILS